MIDSVFVSETALSMRKQDRLKATDFKAGREDLLYGNKSCHPGSWDTVEVEKAQERWGEAQADQVEIQVGFYLLIVFQVKNIYISQFSVDSF